MSKAISAPAETIRLKPPQTIRRGVVAVLDRRFGERQNSHPALFHMLLRHRRVLEAHLRRVAVLLRRGLAAGAGAVELPGALERKGSGHRLALAVRVSGHPAGLGRRPRHLLHQSRILRIRCNTLGFWGA